jgi:acetylglutamate/LysW-gamma-L-alpha-aminoadipate kinase
LLKNADDDSSIINEVKGSQIDQAMDYAQGRMKKKVLAAKEALTGGVPKVVISNANSERPLTKALAGEGTVLW